MLILKLKRFPKMDVVFLLVGLVVGFVVAFLYLKNKGGNELSAVVEKARIFEQEKEELKKERDNKQAEITRLVNELGVQKNEISNLQQRLAEREKDIAQLNEKFTKEFENLANKILDEKGKKFTELNESQIKSILDPLKEKIKDFEGKIHQTHLDQEKERSALKEQLRTFSEMNQKMSQEAINLTNALKGEVKTQGNWGELILERILERSGLRKGVEYNVQQNFTLEDGGRLQPDVVIHLPDSKNLIVDSKVSLTAYEKYNSADTKELQERFLKEHIASIRSHVKGLSGKSYQNLYNIGSPDFVLMFIPIEPAFSLAVGNDDSLYSDAFEKNIIIVSTSTLLATLRTIENIWRQERQNKNVLEIARQSGELYDKFSSVIDDFIKVGAKMKESKDSYDEAMKKLHTGRGNVIARFEALKALGAKTSKGINSKIVERVDEIESETEG